MQMNTLRQWSFQVLSKYLFSNYFQENWEVVNFKNFNDYIGKLQTLNIGVVLDM